MDASHDRSSSVARFYDRWAGVYDILGRHTPGIASVRRRAVEALDLSSGETALEMGCASGANFPHLRENVGPTGRVVGVDVSPGVLKRARQRIECAGWSNVQVCCGDALWPPFREIDQESADRPRNLLATFVVGMLDRPGRAVDRWCDIVGPGGRIVLLHARRSERLGTAPANLALRGFVRFVAPGNRFSASSPILTLERRGEQARGALEARCKQFKMTSLAGGFLALAAGRVRD